MNNYGFNLINDKGYSLVDEKFSNFVFKCSGVIKNSDMKIIDDSTKACQLDISFLNFPLVFFRPITNSSRITTFTSLGSMEVEGQRRGRFLQVNAWSNLNISDIEYFVYDIYKPEVSTKYGLQVYNQENEIIFDSNWKFLKLYGVHWIDPNFPNVNNGELDWTSIGTYNKGNKIAISLPYAREMVIDIDGAGQWVLSDSFWLNPETNEVRISLVPRGQLFWPGLWNGYMQYKMTTQVMIANIEGLPSNHNPLEIL